ncbi:MAG: LLM class flavin-dependent oxidoreductase [Streptosporangiales bacterium]|nr:LLM class flavin-dependent oxidoreductase [Streptosporangiales bacterium]
MATIKIGTGLPWSPERTGSAAVAEGVRHVEQAGLESVWMPDLIIGDGTPAMEAAMVLAAAAAASADPE